MRLLILCALGAALGAATALPASAQCPGTTLVPGDGTDGDFFGLAVRDGDTLLVTASNGDDANGIATGVAYVFQLDDKGTPQTSDDAWVEIDKLEPSDGVAGDRFGIGAELAGTTALIGSRRQIDAGQVYFYERDHNGTPANPFDDSWIEVQRFEGHGQIYPSVLHSDCFGESIAIDGTTAVIGAPFDENTRGTVYFFERHDNATPTDPFDDTWVELDKLVPLAWPGSGIVLGSDVELQGNTALVGALGSWMPTTNKGSVALYGRDDMGTAGDPFDDHWVEIGSLTPASSARQDYFGMEVELSGDLVLVGTPESAFSWFGSGSGRVCSFHRDDGGTPGDPFDDVWTEGPEIVASDGTASAAFGEGLALNGDRLLVGAYNEGLRGDTSGCAYLFERDDAGTPSDPLDDVWIEVEKYVLVDGEAGDQAGRFVELSGTEVMLSCHPGARPGSLRLFEAGDPCTAFVGSRTGQGINVDCLVSVNLPELGAEWRLEVDNTGHPAPAYSIVFGHDRPFSPGVMLTLGELLVDIASGEPLVATLILSSPSGYDVFLFPVPTDPILIGQQLFLQAGVLGGGIGYLSNALNAVAGVMPAL